MKWQKLFPLLIVTAGLLAYHNSFQGVFLFDDHFSILEPPKIRQFWPPWSFLFGSSRPLVDWTLALNYTLGGFKVWGYHAFNLAVHLCAGLTLYGILRRSFLTASLKERFGPQAAVLALIATTVWVIHPLQTQSVTYIIQRSESLMGLFYLLTLYAAIQSAGSARGARWMVVAICASLLGMLSKPVMVTAPVLVLLYDRTFLSSSFKEALQRGKTLYTGLALTWGALALPLVTLLHTSTPTAGFGLVKITSLEYALTQSEILLHYLKLSFFPHPLVLDYHWPPAQGIAEVLPHLLVIGGLLSVTLWGLIRRSSAGFLGVWFFGILAPTSSLFPLTDLAFEHRMYLPLAAVVVFVVALLAQGLDRAAPLKPLRLAVARGSDTISHSQFLAVLVAVVARGGDTISHSQFLAVLVRGIGLLLVIGVIVFLGTSTLRRNVDYRSEIGMWQDVVAKRPENPRAYDSLGVILAKKGHLEEAIASYSKAIALAPGVARTYNNLGMAFLRQERMEEAKQTFREALQRYPDYPLAHNNLATVLHRQGRFEEAFQHYQQALEIDPKHLRSRNNLGLLFAAQGEYTQAIQTFQEVLRLDPTNQTARESLNTLQTKIPPQEGRRRFP